MLHGLLSLTKIKLVQNLRGKAGDLKRRVRKIK